MEQKEGEASLARRRVQSALLLFAGAALFAYLIARQGARDVLDLILALGLGIVPVSLFHLFPLVADAIGWRLLFEPGRRPRLLHLCFVRWIGESVNGLLPVAQVGGELVRARLLARRVPGPRAGASVVGDVTLGVLSQVLFALTGVAILAGIAASGGGNGPPAGLVVGLAAALAAVGGFFLLQRLRLFGRLARLVMPKRTGGRWESLVGGAETLDRELSGMYSHPRRLAANMAWRMAGWILGSGEAWLALWLLGIPVTVGEAIAIESVGQAARTAGFAIPGSLGVQEGGYLFVGRALGLDADVALALSLVRRARDLLLGIPGLVAWQFAEGRHFLRRRGAERSA